MNRMTRSTFALAVGLFALTTAPTLAQTPITDLFNTGVRDNGTPLPINGVVDPHYTNGANNPTYTVIVGGYHIYANADFIAVDRNAGLGNYTVTFNTTFTLPNDVDLSRVMIAGNYSIDNTGEDILINGRSTGIALTGGASINFSDIHAFTLPTTFYQTGVNTLGFVWTNVAGPGAIAISFTSKTFTTALPTVSGTITLQGIVPTASAQAITFVSRATGLPDIVTTQSVASNGAFSILLPKRNGTLTIKGDKYLAKRINLDTTGGNVSGITVTLKVGDANNDNAADIADLLVLINAYNKVSPASGYNFAADFNGDGTNDITDLLLLIGNYNQLGNN